MRRFLDSSGRAARRFLAFWGYTWRRLLVFWAFNVAALLVAARVPGIDFGGSGWVIVLAALVFTAVNMCLRPIVTLPALLVIIPTLGIAYFFVNVAMLYVTSFIVGDFHIGNFPWAALAGTAVVMIITGMLGAAFRGLAEDDPV